MLLLFSILITSCESKTPYKSGKISLNQTCEYDTDCSGNNYCNENYKICSKINIETIQQCSNDTECFDEQGNSLCEDKTKACKCVVGKCKTYNYCENNPCLAFTSENKTKCNPKNTKPFYDCACSENYSNDNGTCTYNCNEFGITNSNNDGCECIAKYKFENGNCFFNCSDIENSHTNDTNQGCDCDFGYTLIGNTCAYDCSNIPNSHPNEENNDCTCDENYFPSSNFCCQENSTYNTELQVCKCNENFHLSENGNCVADTICTTKPCTKEHEICIEDSNETNGYRCECDTNYHNSGNICCQQFYSSNNQSGASEACIPDYTFCTNDGDCINGEICTVNKVEDKIITYCTPPMNGETAKNASTYCQKNEDCKSGTCVKYADDDNDESNGYDGYCAKLCDITPEASPCENVNCGNGGTCTVNEEYYIPQCDCPTGYNAMGTKCEEIASGQGNTCGATPELIINSSGIYKTSNKSSDGYTNNYNPSCSQAQTNNDSVFKLELDKDSTVIIRTMSEIDTIIYLRKGCDTEDIACSDDISLTILRSKIVKKLNKGNYNLFIDSMTGNSDLDHDIIFLVKIIGNNKCLKGTECKPKEVTVSGTTKNINICIPRTDTSNNVITKCYNDADCKTGTLCSYDPFTDTTNNKRTLGCITPVTNCTPSFKENYSSGDYCCSNNYLDVDGIDICSAYCETTLDCPTAYFCNSFTIKDPISTEIKYNSELDSTNICVEKPNTCKNDYECTDSNKPFCTIRDNKDNRLYSICHNRNGFTKDIGANCNSAGFANCYNYACLIEGQGINADNGNSPYCTTPCELSSQCPNGYKCQESTLIYPENDDLTKTCKRTVDSGCISYNMKVCVKE